MGTCFRARAGRELEVCQADEHVSLTAFVALAGELASALLEQLPREHEVASLTDDPRLIGQRIPGRGAARDLDERLQGVLEHDPHAGVSAAAGSDLRNA